MPDKISSDVRVRRAERADVPAIVRLLADDRLGATREIVGTVGEPLAQVYWDAFDAMMQHPGNEYLVAEMEGEVVGCLQLTVMFLWGRVAFGLPLFSHLPGFAVMTIITAAAAAAFGLVLATLARSRAQLSGFSTILILTMSALGGSMFPRFLMTETMQRFGLLTFNAWALDGYLKVFWRNAALWELWPQVLVLIALAATFLSLARLLARRWELV